MPLIASPVVMWWDFFYLHGWPIFNIADSVIVVGVLVLVAVLWWEDRKILKATPKDI